MDRYEARRIHGKSFDYSKAVYRGAQELITITCPTHGDFQQTAHNHLTGFKCQKCATEKMSSKFSYGLGGFIARAKAVHGELYDYRNVRYVNTQTKVTVICPLHGPFEVYPLHHIRGIKCGQCQKDLKRNTREQFISAARLIHGHRYDYDQVVLVMERRVSIEPDDNDFFLFCTRMPVHMSVRMFTHVSIRTRPSGRETMGSAS